MAEGEMDRTVTVNYLTTAELSQLLKTPASTLRYWRTQGEGPPWLKVGNRILYRDVDVHAWAESRIHY